MRFRTLITAVVLSAYLTGSYFSGVASAQGEGESTQSLVAGVGTAQLVVSPTRLRMNIELTAKAPKVSEALGKLKDRRAAVEILLKELAADPNSVTFSEPGLAEASNEQQEMMQQMIRMRMARGERIPEGLKAPKSAAVTCTVTAEWPLEYEGTEELLILAHQLEDRIRDRDLGGLKEPKDLSLEELELQEEMQSADPYGRPSGPAPGEPTFAYVATINEEDRATKMAEAFADAKAKAARLAAAAGMQLGDLMSINGDVSGGGSDPDYYNEYAYMMRQRIAAMSRGGDNETVSAQPGKLTFEFAVQARFRLRQ